MFTKSKLFYTAVLLYLISLVGVFFDSTEFNYRWIWFAIWILSLTLLLMFLFKNKVNLKAFNSIFHDKYLISLAIIAFVVSFLFLVEYPFNSIGDELRDSGNVSYALITGEQKNIFGYGPYNGSGLMPSLVGAIFYQIFPADTLAFKVPSALVSAIDVIVIYIICTKITSKRFAFLGALIILSAPIHLYYGRTELVVIFSSLLTSLMLWAVYNYLSLKSFSNYLIVAFIVSLMLGFQSATRPVAGLACIFVNFVALYYAWRNKKIKTYFFKLAVFIVVLLIAFGPRILFSNSETFLNIDKVITHNTIDYFANYLFSLGVYFYNPTTSHFYLQAPLLNAFYALLFLMGAWFLLQRKAFYIFVLLCLLALPLTNSALTNHLNADHRLLPLFPFIAVALASCFAKFDINFLRYKPLYLFINLVIVLVIMVNLINFFNKEYASYSMFFDTRAQNYQNYLTTYLVKTIKANGLSDSSDTICITANPFEIEHKQRRHVTEYIKFLLPEKHLLFRTDGTYPDRSIAVGSSCPIGIKKEQLAKQVYCSKYEKYACPLDLLPLTIYFDESSE